MNAECLWNVGAFLGEGPLWNPDDARLWFTDIKGHQLHCFDPENGVHESFATPGEPGFVVRSEHKHLIVGMDRGLYIFRDGRIADQIATVDMAPGNRLNDGIVDPQGHLWFGSMDNGETQNTGAFHCYDGQFVRNVTAAGTCPITNGPAVDGTGTLLFAVDTLGRQIWRYRITDGCVLTDRHVYLTLDVTDGTPDGVVCDADGCVWLAVWNGWGVRRYDPDGKLMTTVSLPCAQVTKVAFGGKDLRTAFVTTARIGLDATALEAQPFAGGLFSFPVETPGLPAHAVQFAYTHS